ncbi:hypothetical protein YC2023_026645 [Brassica napus]
MIATSTVKFARELDPNDRHLKSDMTRSRVGLEIQIGTKVKIVNGEDEESKSRDQSDMPRIRSTSDKDRYKIHGFYKNISVVNRPNTRCVSTLSHLSFGLTTRVRLCFLLDFPQAAIIQRSVSEGFKLELHTSDRFKCNSDRPPRLKPLLWVRSMPSSNRNPFRLAKCKNHLWRSVTANIEGEQLPGPIVTCNSAFGGTFYAGSSAGGSAPANDSEVEQEASIQDLVANTCQILAPCCFSSPIIYVA